MRSDKKRILIFNVNWLGDVLFSTAVIRNIRINYPDSYLACVIPPRCLPVLEDNPYLNEIVVFDEKGAHKGARGKLSFARSLRRKKFDAAFLLHRSFTRALIVWLAGIPERVGYEYSKRNFLLTTKIPPPDITRVHRVDYYLGVIKGAGLAVKDRHTNFFYGEKERVAADDFLRVNGVAESDMLVGLNPGGNWGPKRWLRNNFAVLADRLVKELGAKVVITGSMEDIPLSAAIMSEMKCPAFSACGSLSLKAFAALCPKMSVFVSADSGPLHIANAAGAPRIVALYGPTHTVITGPVPDNRVTVIQRDSGCAIPCYIKDCRDNRCMSAISVDDVFKAVKEALYAKN